MDCESQTQEQVTGKAGHVNASDVSSADQCVYAVLSIDQLMLLRNENDYSVSVLRQLETVATAGLLTHQVAAARLRRSDN